MSRTGEIVLTVIGALVYGLFAALGIFMGWLFNNEQLLNEINNEVQQTQPQVAAGEFEAAMDMLGGSGWVLAIVSIIAVILGIVAIILVKGNKKPKAAGIILIVTSVVVALITFGAGIVSGIFYLIAGIMCLARKEPQPLE
ncbi:DUF4064 domain-containing protein [Virgibacillus doumboii]|uniref:DUF4064 domain-containing protein n=1 Tax=Virgibacillus doumboii TaxID=2697503 RepID=UPI0013E091B2|nr:DUF4064 domain-containing protein [Virgibacillus doumboii]